jgi:hypothetical protein
MHIRKAYILIRHFFNVKDDSAGIFFAEEGGGLDWLWSAIEQTNKNDTKFIKCKTGETLIIIC